MGDLTCPGPALPTAQSCPYNTHHSSALWPWHQHPLSAGELASWGLGLGTLHPSRPPCQLLNTHGGARGQVRGRSPLNLPATRPPPSRGHRADGREGPPPENALSQPGQHVGG